MGGAETHRGPQGPESLLPCGTTPWPFKPPVLEMQGSWAAVPNRPQPLAVGFSQSTTSFLIYQDAFPWKIKLLLDFQVLTPQLPTNGKHLWSS